MVTSLINPSYHQNFARYAGESKRPNLWRGLVGAWKPSLGITGITTLRDVSGFANHGTMQGSMSIEDWVIGGNPRLPGYALDFEGTDDFVEISSVPDISGDKLTMMAWVKAGEASADGFNGIVGGNTSGTEQIMIGQWSGTSDLWLEVETDVGNFFLHSAGALSTTEFKHVAMVYDGSNIMAYVNGIFIDQAAASGNLLAWDVIYPSIGRGSVGDFFSGQIDDSRIYKRVILPAEMLDIYNNPNAMFELRDRVIGKAPAVAGVLRRNLTLMGAGK